MSYPPCCNRGRRAPGVPVRVAVFAISGGAAAAAWLALLTPVWFTQEVAGTLSYYNVLHGMSTHLTPGPGLQTRTQSISYLFCPGNHTCDSFTWNWVDRSVWAMVDTRAGSCMSLEAHFLRWALPFVWSTCASLASASTGLLAVGVFKPIPARMTAFCGCLSFLAAGGAALLLFHLLCTDVLNSHIWSLFYEAQFRDFYRDGLAGCTVAVTVRATTTFYMHIVPAVVLSGTTAIACFFMIN